MHAHYGQCKEGQYRNCDTHTFEREEHSSEACFRQRSQVPGESKNDYGEQAGGTWMSNISDASRNQWESTH